MINSLQKAIYQKLTSENFTVLDVIEEDAKMPYVKLGNTSLKDIRIKTGEVIHFVTWGLSYFYDGGNKGRKEVNSKYMDIYNSLYEMIYEAAGEYEIIDCKLSENDSNGIEEHYIDENTILYEGSISFDFTLQRRN